MVLGVNLVDSSVLQSCLSNHFLGRHFRGPKAIWQWFFPPLFPLCPRFHLDLRLGRSWRWLLGRKAQAKQVAI